MATAHYIIVSLLFFFFISCYFAQSPAGDKSTPNPCTPKPNCSACITSSNLCAWCQQQDYSQNNVLLPRCDLFAQLILKGCDISNIVNPRSEANFTKNDSLSNVGEADAVQIKPQEIILKLRPNEPFTLKVDFRQAEDYPVDLYYLMDLSNSMEDDKAKLAELGDLLAKRMSNITKDFQLGFGSFVDKVVMPFVSTVPAKLEKPCDQRDGTACAKPYGFHNHMPLDLNTSRFATEVSDAKVSGNLDAPEGGFDAIMQSIACQNEIRWRNQSRKLLVFSTDAGFHHAGDGKLGGIVKPNDGNCHLNASGYYNESNSMDYPSLSQINQKILDHKINTIFAVTADQLPIYERLSEHIDGAISAHLENDSSNIVELIKDQYEKISSKVELNVNATSSVKVNMVSNCLGTTSKKTNVCQGLKVGSTVSFDVTFSVESCPKDPKELNQLVQIDPIGIKEQLLIRLEILCECDCEKPQYEIANSDYCFDGNGTYECGICNCNKNRYGQLCECGSEDVNKVDYVANCTAPNAVNACSGRGTCECGKCKCNEDFGTGQIWGQFCECDNLNCPRSSNKLCGGHGHCDCNKCICDLGYSGEACGCSTSNATCIASNGKLCNDKGECVCGTCICNDTGPERYSGPHCDKCPICANKCQNYKACVQCWVFKTGPIPTKDCTLEHCGFKPEEVDELVEGDDITICKDKDDDDCTFRYSYFSNETHKLYIEVERTKTCPEAVPILPIILGVIGGIVAIGLALLLIWKLLTTIHDRREFAKFEKERQNAKWDTGENPIYKQATSTFKNPTYGGK